MLLKIKQQLLYKTAAKPYLKKDWVKYFCYNRKDFFNLYKAFLSRKTIFYSKINI